MEKMQAFNIREERSFVPASGANATRSGGTKSMLLMFSTQE
jgi:hypothetical protein